MNANEIVPKNATASRGVEGAGKGTAAGLASVGRAVGRVGFPGSVVIMGVDLAWGVRNPDGVCLLRVKRHSAQVLDLGLSWGDGALAELVASRAGTGSVLLTVDAPIVLPNWTGMRPVDRLAHVHFGRYKCGCYPANRRLCPRPAAIGELLAGLGFPAGWQGPRCAAEVYPHPALVRWFELSERIPYKKGKLADKRVHFAILQEKLRGLLAREFPLLEDCSELESLLEQPWSKGIEDQTDALICALIGYWHYLHGGKRSQILGTLEEGFLLLPR